MKRVVAAGRGGASDRPARVVALGGGTGLPAVLRGLRHLVEGSARDTLTAVVTMTDDGGSSGRLRRQRGLPPPGDVRNCLVALSAEEDLLAGLFQHRYDGGEELGGHSLGNLILAALAEQTGSFLKAVEVSSRVLRTAGRILPATLEDVVLEARRADGTTVVGETAIGACSSRITRLTLRPATPRPTAGVVEAIERADLIVLGPGSLFTSVLPNLLLEPITAAIRGSRATCVLVGNLVSERGEAAGLSLGDHLDLIAEHSGARIIDVVLVHDGAIDAPILERYRAEGAAPLGVPREGLPGVDVVRRDLLAPGPKLRHDPDATAAGLLEAWRRAERTKPGRVTGGATPTEVRS